MKIAAISLLSAANALPARRAAAPYGNGFEERRQGDRRRQRAAEAVRMTPVNRLITGLAVQVIAQLDKPESTDVAAARAAYRNKIRASGEVVNYRA